MREIKFRGKRLKDEEWITGDLITETDSDLKVKRSFIHLRLSPISFTEDALSSTICFHEVDPETVGEYTGLKDRNGKEIYDGDIVDGEHRAAEFIMTNRVSFLNGCFMFGNWNAHEYFNKHTGIQVIGNIHENSDLLEKEDKPCS